MQGVVLAEAGEEIESVYFPLGGMISIVVVMKDGKAIETATVGRDGVFGAMVGFGPYVSKVRAIVQMPMTAIRIPSLQFRKATQEAESCRIFASIITNSSWSRHASVLRAMPCIKSRRGFVGGCCRHVKQPEAIPSR